MAAAGSSCAFRLSTLPAVCSATKSSRRFIRSPGNRDEGVASKSVTFEDCQYLRHRVTKMWKRCQKSRQLLHLRSGSSVWWLTKKKTRHCQVRVSSAPSEEGVTVNRMPFTQTDEENLEEVRKLLTASLRVVETGTSLVQVLHEIARMLQVAMEQQRSLTKGSWFAKAWLGIDQNAWMKSIAYQVAVHALLQAALEIAIRGEGKDRDTHIIVQQSLFRLCNPLEDSIRRQLSPRDPAAEEWLWYQQHPVAVSSFMSSLEKDPRFIAITTMDSEAGLERPGKESDITLLMLAMSLCAAIMKLGPVKLSCSPFSIALKEETGRLMNSLVKHIPIDQVYLFTSSVGLRHEFLAHFGSRAARDNIDLDVEEKERIFWVDLVQQLLRGAFAREGVRAKLTTCPNMEVLEQDLAVFGFFTALGRRARSFLSVKKIDDIDDSFSSLLRYLEGGCVLFYPQLATLTAYQLFVEVVCEELSWIPLFKENKSVSYAHTNVMNDKVEVNESFHEAEAEEALATVLNACLYWVEDFKAYSHWIQQAESVRAIKFLSNIQCRVDKCVPANGITTQKDGSKKIARSRAATEVEQILKRLLFEDEKRKDKGERKTNQAWNWEENQEQPLSIKPWEENIDFQDLEQQLKFFDEDLKKMEEVLSKLENLLQDSEMPTSRIGREHLTAIRVDLRKIRHIKKEAEALEASLKSKASLKEQRLEQEKEAQRQLAQNTSSSSRSLDQSADDQGEDQERSWQQRSRVGLVFEGATHVAQGLAKKLPFLSSSNETVLHGEGTSTSSTEDDDAFEIAAAAALEEAAAVSNELSQFEFLRKELVQLDARIRDCAGETAKERSNTVGMLQVRKTSDIQLQEDTTNLEKEKMANIFVRSIDKFKNASSDALKGTQLLATDVAVAVCLIRRSISGHNLTEREKKILRRTLTDLASVIPIGFLMLLPVTAVGHAAMLAAIQKYVPGLIPSAYAPERLDLVKQLEHLKQMEAEVTVVDTELSHSTFDSERANGCSWDVRS